MAINQVNIVTPESTKPLFLAVGLEFYQEVNGIGYCESNYFFALWQIKSDTLAGSFAFLGSKNGFNHRQNTNCQSHFSNLQKQ